MKKWLTRQWVELREAWIVGVALVVVYEIAPTWVFWAAVGAGLQLLVVRNRS